METMQARSRFQRRSFMRSETKPQTTRPMPPQMYGTIVNQPTVMLLVTPMVRSRSGLPTRDGFHFLTLLKQLLPLRTNG